MSERRKEWEDICHSLAPENLYEDGQLHMEGAERKRNRILRHARALYWAGYPCPKDVLDRTDDEEALRPYVWETSDE